MDSLSRVKLYLWALESNVPLPASEMWEILAMNIDMLTGIEEHFLTPDYPVEVYTDRTPNNQEIIDAFETSIQRVEAYRSDPPGALSLIKKIREDFDVENRRDKKINTRRLFKTILQRLAEYGNEMENQIRISGRFKERKEGMPQVFLSHAYDDCLFAWVLFEYLYSQGIYLYVYWMHHGKIDDGLYLKLDLQNTLMQSEQLLFLNHLNGELGIPGNHMIRPWCAWELGNYYYVAHHEKYIFNLYSSGKNLDNNIHLHGLKLFTGIRNKRLVGVTIPLKK